MNVSMHFVQMKNFQRKIGEIVEISGLLKPIYLFFVYE